MKKKYFIPIAFFSGGTIKTIPVQGGQPEVLFAEVKSGLHSQLAYSPDGLKIAHNAQGKIWITPLDGGVPEELRTGLPKNGVKYYISRHSCRLQEMCGFASIRCPDCGEERLPMFSCKTRGFCPSCHAKRREEWGVILKTSVAVFCRFKAGVYLEPIGLEVLAKLR